MAEPGTIAERYQVELETRSTGSTSVGVVSALSVALLVASHQGNPGTISEHLTLPIVQHATDGSSSEQSARGGESQILNEVERIYGQLLSAQVELDDTDRKILYSNLWDLYGD